MYRFTPQSTTLKTPSEIMFGRNIRDKLPNMRDEEISDRDRVYKEKEKQNCDK